MELLVSIASSAVGYLTEDLSTTGAFPRLAMGHLKDSYNRHIEYLKRQVQANRQDPDTVKDLKETIDEVTDRRDTVVTILELHSMEHNKVPKMQDRLAEDRAKAKKLYQAFVAKYPRG